MITIPCPRCGAEFGFPDELRDSTVRCQSCREPFVIRVPESARRKPDAGHETRLQEKPRSSPVAAMRPVRAERPPVRSKQTPPKGSSALPLLLVALLFLGAMAVVLVLVAVIGAAAWFLVSPRNAGPGGPAVANTTVTATEDKPDGPANDGRLRYRWQGGPHVYHVRVEVDRGDSVDVHEGRFVLNVGAGPRRQPAGAGDRKASGTGFVIHRQGWVVTCAHVVADAAKVEVVVDGRTFPAQVVGRNVGADLAILRINTEIGRASCRERVSYSV